MASDDDQRQVERMMSRTPIKVENEITCPEAGEEVDVRGTNCPATVRSRGRSATIRNTVSATVSFKNSQFP